MIGRIFPFGLLTCSAALLCAIFGCNDAEPTKSQSNATDSSAAPVVEPAEPAGPYEPPGMLLHLTFDKKTLCKTSKRFLAKDLTSNKNGAFIRDAVPVKGKFGTALSFDGNKSRVGGSDTALPASASPVSISLWFLARKTQYQVLFSYGTPKSPYLREMSLLSPKGLCFFHFNNDNCEILDVEVSLNEWHHFAATYDDVKREVTFYLDGVNRGKATGFFFTSRAGYVVGSAGGESVFDGLIDEVIVCSGVLSEADIQTLYKQKEYADDWNYAIDTLPECN